MNVTKIEINNKLFISKNYETNIMIRLGTKCLNNCFNCSLSNDLNFNNTSNYTDKVILEIRINNIKNNLRNIKKILSERKKDLVKLGINEFVFNIKNVKLSIKQNHIAIIDNKNKIIKKLNYKNYALNKNLDIINNKIYIKDEIEVDLIGNIYFHYNEFCYKGKKTIINLFEKKDILSSFIKYKEFLNKKYKKPAEIGCYECINS